MLHYEKKVADNFAATIAAEKLKKAQESNINRNEYNNKNRSNSSYVQPNESIDEKIKRHNDERNNARRKVYLSERNKSSSAIDASLYEINYNLESRFIVCAICEQEGSQVGSRLVEDCIDLIKMSGIQEKYQNIISDQSCSNEYDKIFIDEVSRHFDSGLIKGMKSLCVVCLSSPTVHRSSPSGDWKTVSRLVLLALR